MHAYLYLVALLVVTGWSIRRGGAPERLAATAILLAVAATIALGSRNVFGDREIGLFAVDLVLTLAIFTLAMLAERFWPLWLAAILIVSLMLQLAIWYAPLYYRDVYLILHATSAYPTLVLVAIGTMRHRNRIRRHGSDPAWSTRRQTSLEREA